jgi:hypothetical protein
VASASIVFDGEGGANMKTSVAEIKQKILPILQRHEVKRAALFGSCVRGEMTEESDVDVLVQIDKDISLLDLVGIKLELEDALGRKVDLVEFDTIKPLLRERILSEQVTIL